MVKPIVSLAAASQPIRILLLSGMGADESILWHAQKSIPGLEVVAWRTPRTGESLEDYTWRLTQELGLGSEPVILGGVSFGGVVALEWTRHVSALGCILIGSLRQPEHLPLWVRPLRHWSPRWMPIRTLTQLGAPASRLLSWIGWKRWGQLAGLASHSEPELLRWSIDMLLQWRGVALDVPIGQIHGDRDSVLPCYADVCDQTVAGGGHVISLSHPAEVTRFIEQCRDQWLDSSGRTEGERSFEN